MKWKLLPCLFQGLEPSLSAADGKAEAQDRQVAPCLRVTVDFETLTVNPKTLNPKSLNCVKAGNEGKKWLPSLLGFGANWPIAPVEGVGRDGRTWKSVYPRA